MKKITFSSHPKKWNLEKNQKGDSIKKVFSLFYEKYIFKSLIWILRHLNLKKYKYTNDIFKLIIETNRGIKKEIRMNNKY